jgi:hypothetical protein
MGERVETAGAMRVTLRPECECVLVGKKWARPLVCNDVLTIVQDAERKHSDENLSAHCGAKRPRWGETCDVDAIHKRAVS